MGYANGYVIGPVYLVMENVTDPVGHVDLVMEHVIDHVDLVMEHVTDPVGLYGADHVDLIAGHVDLVMEHVIDHVGLVMEHMIGCDHVDLVMGRVMNLVMGCVLIEVGWVIGFAEGYVMVGQVRDLMIIFRPGMVVGGLNGLTHAAGRSGPYFPYPDYYSYWN